MSKKIGAVLMGLIVIFAGLGYGAQALGLIESFTIFFPGWWTLFLIVPGISALFRKDSSKLFSVALIVVGIGLLIQQNLPEGMWQGVSFFKLLVPFLVVIGGVCIIVNAFTGGKRSAEGTVSAVMHTTDGSLPKYMASFGDVSPNYAGEIFEGCELEASFGHAMLDLRQAVIENDCTIEVSASFGGVEIWLPSSCRLELNTVETNFGGTENRFINSAVPGAPLVRINVTASFGGVEIK